MSEFLASYVLRVLFSTPSSAHGGNTTALRWRRLASFPFEPYRPELHYARPRPEMAREARARRRAATAQLVVWARTRFMRVVCRSIALGLLVA